MNLHDIFKAIEKSSNELIKGEKDLKLKIKFAKNFVANQDMTEWAFSKLIATKNFNVKRGGEAKPFFYKYGFLNVLEMKDSSFKENVINNFLKWSESIDYFDLKSKFHKYPTHTHPFELLVHMDQIPKEGLKKDGLLDDNLEEFIEGFKREIIIENNYRDKKLIKEAKEKFKPICSVCEFNFEEKYGLHGRGFIEMHHLLALSTGERKSTLKDIVPVCSNCHRMLHKGEAMLSIEDLKRIISENTSA